MKTYRVSGSVFYEMPFVLEIKAESGHAAVEEALEQISAHSLRDLDGNRIRRDQTRAENPVFVEEVE